MMRTVKPAYGWVASALLATLLAAPLTLHHSPAHAALFEDKDARLAIIDLREKNRLLEERIVKLEAAARGQLELASQLEALRQEVARLRGQSEVMANELANLQQRQKDFYTDLDTRLRKFEPQEVSIDGQAATVDPVETKAFEAGMDQFKSSNFKSAIVTFNQFQKQYPDSIYAPAAQYWIGTSHYALREYKSAVAAQQVVVNRWPDSPRAPEAVLNIASSQADMGDKANARKTLQNLIAKYPDSPAAAIAQERLATLR